MKKNKKYKEAKNKRDRDMEKCYIWKKVSYKRV